MDRLLYLSLPPSLSSLSPCLHSLSAFSFLLFFACASRVVVSPSPSPLCPPLLPPDLQPWHGWSVGWWGSNSDICDRRKRARRRLGLLLCISPTTTAARTVTTVGAAAATTTQQPLDVAAMTQLGRLKIPPTPRRFPVSGTMTKIERLIPYQKNRARGLFSGPIRSWMEKTLFQQKTLIHLPAGERERWR